MDKTTTALEKAKVKDWLAVAKLAGKHGIRYRTNTALEAFLTEVTAALEQVAEPVAWRRYLDGWAICPPCQTKKLDARQKLKWPVPVSYSGGVKEGEKCADCGTVKDATPLEQKDRK